MDLYHLLNRGVDKRDIYQDEEDRQRFVYGLWSFNDTRPIANTYEFLRSGSTFGLRKSKSAERKAIVDIHAWCLMKNHYHLLVSERVDGGLTQFIKKLNIGYAKYFNERYQRNGTLFQGRTKKIPIETDAQWNYILHYIHLNPLDYLKGAESWRIRSKGGVKNAREALEYLKKYRWSSYLDYVGENNFPSLLATDIVRNASDDYEKDIAGYLRSEEQEDSPALNFE